MSTRVFLSYSWDDDRHKTRVLGLAQHLRAAGIDAWIDRFTLFPVEGWPRWMHKQIEAADFVLCIVTKAYAERFLGESPPDGSRGGNWEGSIITDHIYRDASQNTKFIPVVFEAADVAHIPHPLSQYSRFCLARDGAYDDLYRLLTEQPEILPLGLGKMRFMPSGAGGLGQPAVHNHRRNRGNLPRLPYFFGRKDDLADVAEALTPARRTWGVLIDGIGGIGKTSLAIRAAELTVEDEYPRILFFSAKSRALTPEGRQPVEDFLMSGYLAILNALARGLEREDLLKIDETERAAALHSVLRQQSALLVIDNVESLPESDRNRLFNFLGTLPEPCKAIVTGRRHSDVEAKHIRLDRLPWEAASALLNELAEDRPLLASSSESQRRLLYDETGGNPLILRWVAGQLGRGRCRTVDGALHLLKSSPAGEDALEFIFGDLNREFTLNEMNLLTALTYFTQPVAVRQTAKLAALSQVEAQTELEGLVDRALVTADAEFSHFGLAPLVADFLRPRKPGVVRRRLADMVYDLAFDNGFEHYNRFPILVQDWAIVEAGIPLLDDERLQSVCDALTAFLDFEGRWDERILLNRLAEDRAVARGDFKKAGWRACQEAAVRFHFGSPLDVLAAAERADGHWQKTTPDSYAVGVLARRRGMAYVLQQNYAAALNAYSQTLGLWRSLSTHKDVARVLNDIGDVQLLMSKPDDAERHYGEALRIASEQNFDEGIATAKGGLAELALQRCRWQEAEVEGRQALALAKRVHNRELIAGNCRRVAQALAWQGRRDEGAGFARQAVEIFTALRSPELIKAQRALLQCVPPELPNRECGPPMQPA